MAQNPQQNRQTAVAKREPDAGKIALAEATGLSVQQIDPFVTMFKDSNGNSKPYIGRDGRRYKMDQRFGAGSYEIKTDLPTVERYQMLKQMWGIAPNKPCIIMECRIFVDGVEKACDWGTATPGNMLAGATQFEKRGLEIATTRAINRAMGQLIAGGFSDVDNKYVGRYNPIPDSPQGAFRDEMQKLKKVVGEEAYYAVLDTWGYDHSNETVLMTDCDSMDGVLKDLKALAAQQATKALFDAPGNPNQMTHRQDTEIRSLLMHAAFADSAAVADRFQKWLDGGPDFKEAQDTIQELKRRIDEFEAQSVQGDDPEPEPPSDADTQNADVDPAEAPFVETAHETGVGVSAAYAYLKKTFQVDAYGKLTERQQKSALTYLENQQRKMAEATQ